MSNGSTPGVEALRGELIRRTPTLPDLAQAVELRRLKITHRRVLTLHLMGLPGTEIATRLGKSTAFVYNTIRSAPGQAFLNRAYEIVDCEIKALMPKAVEAIRRNLDCDDGQIEVRAAEQVMKLNKKYDDSSERQLTAEDVIERVLEQINPDGTRIRLSEKRIYSGVVRGAGSEVED